MTEKPRLKTIGISEPVWRKLKILALQEGCTLSEVVEKLLDQAKRQESAGPPKSPP